MGTFRSVTEDERATHQRIKDHVWGEGGVPDPDETVPRALGERWAYVEDGRFRSICALLEIDVRLAGEWRTIGGIRGFVTPPEHRGQGYGRRLLRGAVAEFADRGLSYAVLWPASIDYYRERGWGLVHTETAYAFPPEAMADPGPAGRFERVGPDDFGRLEAVWETEASDYELALRRTGQWWRERVLDDAWAYTWTPDGDDEPAGYVVYRLNRDAETLTVEELAVRSERARRQLLGFLERHAPQADRVEWTCPRERRLLREAADPDAVEASVEPGASGYVVDVPAAIETLPAERGPAKAVTIEVTDPLAPRNDGQFRVEPDMTCRPLETGATIDDPGLVVDAAVLAQLYVGTLSIETAAAREIVTATDDAVAALSETFGARDVYVSDFF
ncbi:MULTISPECIES: GNAT family N-acetyltransferase [Halomicrobium]|uniref:GCN5-related N-acetyltransferase n=2 Tax=Halomicrobium mukohataei TaxID=57705 RepID=C7NZ44_HALMD|nr:MULTISPECIES: GNAT family N-acetyltransferase [Halomicrobium]ACV46730.1 GCN5-related N-acetyltransferase [Halomicrobium mukohataei DSM 12286]QCD65239.1 GNAT family N-acetyltransferase [Halomicrobium mukohataei]QFR20045.1 GNAT family N-acetyltransferase [Halomicrobium sp. ZPS1]